MLLNGCKLEEGVYKEGVNLVLELSSNFYIFSLSTSIVLIKTDVLRVRELPNPKISEPKIALFLLNYLQRGFIIKDCVNFIQLWHNKLRTNSSDVFMKTK